MNTKPAVTLEVGKFANLHMHSDCHPYEIVRVVSAQTIELRRMTAVLDKSFQPDIAVGGFAGHCSNQQDQKWIYSVDESAPIIRARFRKWRANNQAGFYSVYGRHVLSEQPFKFHDYNF